MVTITARAVYNFDIKKDNKANRMKFILPAKSVTLSNL